MWDHTVGHTVSSIVDVECCIPTVCLLYAHAHLLMKQLILIRLRNYSIQKLHFVWGGLQFHKCLYSQILLL